MQRFFTCYKIFAVIYLTLLLSTEILVRFCFLFSLFYFAFSLFFNSFSRTLCNLNLYVYQARVKKLAPYGCLINVCVTIHVRFM